jgi:hypothetical protein
MQTIWSRAAQAQASCRCRVCLHTTNTLVRRSTTAASRQKVSAADIFTACYTTILGAAAIIDANRKDARRKELDESLERAKAALNDMGIKDATGPSEDHGPDRSLDAAGKGTRCADTAGEKSTRDVSTILGELGQLAAAAFPLISSPSWNRSQLDWIHVEAAVAAEEKDFLIHLRHPKNEGQLAKTTRTVEALVQSLLWQARQTQNAESQTQNPPGKSQGDLLLDEAESLLGAYPMYRSVHVEPEAATKDREYLSTTFRRILNGTSDAKEAVGKICYNLLVSNAAPNIHNYNTLIAGFNRIRRPDLAQSVVESYLDQTRWPATQQTIVCLLNHARGTNDLTLFREVVGRMRGAAEDGMHLRIFDKASLHNELGWKWMENATERKHAYVERATRGVEIFDSLIRGWLHFDQIQTAGMAFVACLRNKQLIPAETLDELLSECLSVLDQNAARVIIEGMAKNLAKFETFMEHIIAQSPAQLASKITDMFCTLYDFCGFVYRPTISKATEGIRDLLQRFRENVAANPCQETKETNLVCHGILPKPSDSTKRIVLQSPSSSRSGDGVSIGSLAAVVKRYQYLEETTKRMSAQAKAVILKRRIGQDFNPSNSLPPIVAEGRGNRVIPAVFYALQAIQINGKKNTLNDVKAELLAGLPDREFAEKCKMHANWENLSIQTLVSFYDPRRPRRKSTGSMSRTMDRTARLQDEKNTAKVSLFCQLSGKKQSRLVGYYKDWRSIPTEKLQKYYEVMMRHRGIKYETLTGTATEPKADELMVVDKEARVPQTDEDSSIQELSWASPCPPPRRHVDLSLGVTKSAAALSAPPRRRVWSGELDRSVALQQAAGSVV